jgi:ribose transport system permease protein
MTDGERQGAPAAATAGSAASAGAASGGRGLQMPKGRAEWLELVFRFQSLFGLLAVFIAAIVFSPARNGEILFLTTENLANVVRSVSEIGIIAVGMTFVILIGGIDLSVGALVGLAASGVAVLMMKNDYGVAPAVVVILVIGTAFGAIQGLISSRLAIQSFIVTLAGLQVARGLARIWADGQGVPLAYGNGSDLAPDSFSVLNERILNGYVPVPALIFLLVGLVAIFVLRRTTFSRHLYAIGGNERAARLSRGPIGRIKVAVFAISGFLAALAGIIHAGQLNQGSPNDGAGYELDAIAAVVIGGTSLFGGRGTVAGTLGGALLLGILNNMLALNNVDANVQLLIKGLVIVAAAALLTLRSSNDS